MQRGRQGGHGFQHVQQAAGDGRRGAGAVVPLGQGVGGYPKVRGKLWRGQSQAGAGFSQALRRHGWGVLAGFRVSHRVRYFKGQKSPVARATGCGVDGCSGLHVPSGGN